MLPSQFVDVVLEEKDPCSSAPTNSERKREADKGQKVRLTCGDNNNCVPFDGWNLGKKLPEALLSECTVEICTDPRRKRETPRLRFEARVTPIYKNNVKGNDFRSGRFHEVDSGEECAAGYDNYEAAGGEDAQDMLSEVEAVYSEHESDSEVGVDSAPTQPIITVTGTSVEPKRPPIPTFANPSFRCEHCPNTYGNRGALWQHCLAAHSPRKNCECGICGRRFYRNCSLALHLKSHDESAHGGGAGGGSGSGGIAPVSTCPECGKEFAKASTLEKHIRVTHIPSESTGGMVTSSPPSQSNVIVCPQCPKTFMNTEHLEQHLRLGHRYLPPALLQSITSPGALVCPSCCLRFYSAQELARHEASCSPRGRPYQCQYCKKSYSQKSVLKKHLVIHTGERLTCALCGIDFTQKSSLLRHVKRMHSAAAVAAAQKPDPQLNNVQAFMQNIRIPRGISISMVD